jgi:hypothetical protein
VDDRPRAGGANIAEAGYRTGNEKCGIALPLPNTRQTLSLDGLHGRQLQEQAL